MNREINNKKNIHKEVHNHIYRATTEKETLIPHGYICSYANKDIKHIIHTYKFTKNTSVKVYLAAKVFLVSILLDMVIYFTLERKSEPIHLNKKSLYIYTSPPSTMFERKEKEEDSMFELLKSVGCTMSHYISKETENKKIKILSVYKPSLLYLKGKRAQHIGGSRQLRTKDMESRYTVKISFKIKLLLYIHVYKIKHFDFTVVDDVSSTGATLLACKKSLSIYMSIVQEKNPHISFDIEIFSLCH